MRKELLRLRHKSAALVSTRWRVVFGDAPVDAAPGTRVIRVRYESPPIPDWGAMPSGAMSSERTAAEVIPSTSPPETPPDEADDRAPWEKPKRKGVDPFRDADKSYGSEWHAVHGGTDSPFE